MGFNSGFKGLIFLSQGAGVLLRHKVVSKSIICNASKTENKLIWRHSVIGVLSGLFPRLLSNSKKKKNSRFSNIKNGIHILYKVQ